MATNIKYEPGWSLNLTCTNPDKPNSGDPVRIGNLTGIALTDEDAAGKTVVNTGPFVAKFSVKDNGGTGIAIGAPIWYHDDATPVLDNVPTGGYYYGIALEAVTAEQTATIQVYHDCAPGGAGTIGNGTVGTAQIAASGVTADKLSAAARTRAVTAAIGAVTANAEKAVFVAPTDGTITGVQLLNSTAITADSTNYWTFQIVNKGAAGAGTDVVAAIDTNSGESGDGESLAEFVATDLTVVAGEADFEAGDVLSFKAIKTASAAALADTVIVITYAPVEAE
jgi:predicted RecA/RadA family phage recombinase